jgi:hypothetical protein
MQWYKGFSHPALNTHTIYNKGNGSLVAAVAVAWLTASQLWRKTKPAISRTLINGAKR